MDRRPLGDSGLEVSVLGLGTWAMGGAVESWGRVDDRESIAAIRQALDCGITLIDTAPIYGLGHAEEVVGKAIRGRRDEVVLATKCGLVIPRSEDETPARCLSANSVRRECEASLRRMGTEVIDLYQCHWPDPNTPIRETMSALAELRKVGKIRAIGLSNFSCDQMAAALEFGPIHCLQTSFSMLSRRAAEALIPFCTEHKMATLAYSPLAKGLLTGKFSSMSKFEGIRARDPEFIGERLRRNLEIVEQLRPIAAAYDKTVTQLVVNWTATFPGVTAPLFGAKLLSQVVEAAGGIGWSITSEDRKRIDSVLGRLSS